MNITAFWDFQDFFLQVFGPWLMLWLASLLAGGVTIALFMPFFTVIKIMTRRPG